VRVRVFLPQAGVEEDEATGAHAVRLAARLGRELTVHQGTGSIILARPLPDGSVEIGGRTELVEIREYKGEFS
jgi:predicted PhzF superfamily epimerase YddE/YHI9